MSYCDDEWNTDCRIVLPTIPDSLQMIGSFVFFASTKLVSSPRELSQLPDIPSVPTPF